MLVFLPDDESDRASATNSIHEPQVSVSQPASPPPVAPVVAITAPSPTTAAVVGAGGFGSTMAVDVPTEDLSISNDPVPITRRRIIKQGDHYYPNIWFEGYEAPSLEV
jgi:hypothetical protein